MLSTFLSIVVLLVGLMLTHKWSPFFGSVLCSALAFYGIRRLLQQKLNILFFTLGQNVESGSQRNAFLCGWTSSIGALIHRVLQRRRVPFNNFSADELTVIDSYLDERCDRHCSPESAHVAEVKTYVENVKIRYIDSWYRDVSSNTDFPKELDFIVEDVLLAICERLSSVDPCRLVEHTITVFHGHYQNYVKSLEKSRIARSGASYQQCDVVEHFELNHWALKDEIHERCYMQSVTSVLVGFVQPPNVLSSPATNALVIEILTNNITAAVVDLLSDPAWLNGAVVYLCNCENDPDVLSFTGSQSAELVREVSPQGCCDGPLSQQPDGAPDSVALASDGLAQHQPHQWKPLLSVNLPSRDSKTNEELLNKPKILGDSGKQNAEGHTESPKVYFSAQEDAAELWPFNDVEQAVEAEDYLGSLTFSDIRITRTESRTVPGKGVHTVYCIEYQTTTTEEGHCIICKEHTTWKRFREFLDLQSSLERNPVLDRLLKGIHGPSRWLGSRLSDKKNVLERRVFLERYLRDLCSRKIIANSAEFHKFLDFGMDVSSSVPKTPPPSSTRIDKMLAQGVKDAFDLFRRLHLDDHSINLLSPSENLRNLAEFFPGETDFTFSDKQVPPLQQTVYNFLDNFDQASSPEFSPPQTPSGLRSTRDVSPSSPSLQSHTGSCGQSVNFGPAFGVTADNTDELRGPLETLNDLIGSISSDIPLSSATVDLVLDVVSGLEVVKSARLVLFLELLIGKVLEKWLAEQAHGALRYTRGIAYIHRLHEKLWGESSTRTRFSKDQAKLAIEKSVPFPLYMFLGAKNVKKSADLVVESLQMRALNKCLVYQLLDRYVHLLTYQEQCDLNSDNGP